MNRWFSASSPSGKEFALVAQVKSSELMRRLADDGWSCGRQSGGHAIYRHPTKPGQLTVPIHPAKEIP
jgi:predicted RNA binding protein YcfA (HicA-like mRNA interferase family)